MAKLITSKVNNIVIELDANYKGLLEEITQNLYNRQSDKTLKTTNFHNKLPTLSSELAHEMIKAPGPTIGLLLCEKKDRVIAEYALKRVDSSIGIAEYEVLKELPSRLQKILPTINQIEAELSEFNSTEGEE